MYLNLFGIVGVKQLQEIIVNWNKYGQCSCVWVTCAGPQQGLAGVDGLIRVKVAAAAAIFHLTSHFSWQVWTKDPEKCHCAISESLGQHLRNEPDFAHYANHIDSISDAFIRLIIPKVTTHHSKGLVFFQSCFCECLDWLKGYPTLNWLRQLIMLHLISMKYKM